MVAEKKELTKEIEKIMRKWLRLSHYKIFFFGSRVKGRSNERSDYDVGIETSEKVPLTTLAEIEAELEELPIMNKIDVVDFNSVSGDFKRVASENIKIIYEQ
jgi:predicted nucleotidyltransferase